MSVLFEDYSKDVIDKINKLGVSWLEEASSVIQSQTQKNTKVKTGRTKGSWEHEVDGYKLEAIVGSRYNNALWEELGTGIYALNGDGRKTPWVYKDANGTWHKTRGKKPRRAFYKAYNSKKNVVIRSAQERFKNL